MFEPWSWQISIRLWFALDMNNLSILVMWCPTDIYTRPLHRQILCIFVTQLVVASTDSHSNISKYLLGSYIPKRCCGFQTCSFNYQALLFLLFSRCKVKSESWITQLVRFRIYYLRLGSKWNVKWDRFQSTTYNLFRDLNKLLIVLLFIVLAVSSKLHSVVAQKKYVTYYYNEGPNKSKFKNDIRCDRQYKGNT